MRTSVSHPLQIAAVVSGLHGFGRVGVTFCPGKYDPFGMTGRWNRDLTRDLDAIRDCGAAAAVTLLEPDELTLLRVERLGVEVSRRNMSRLHRRGVAIDPAWWLRRVGPLPRRTGRDRGGKATGRTRRGARDSDRKCACATTGRNRER